MVEGKGGRTLANTTMIYSGAVTGVFLIVHVWNVRFCQRGPDGLYGVLVHLFQNPAYSAFYIASVIVVGAHVWHGAQSAFRSLGVHHPKWTPAIEWASRIFGVAVAVGFASLPLWVMFGAK
ncbi:MAG: hypothetical protein NTW86_29695 [Candidatus Sumerlaeota bacterium]|nr:hypothetical protein [Candidatus Sumerlaeota bacterium]